MIKASKPAAAYLMQLAGPKVKGKVSELKVEFQRENGATKPARVTRLLYSEVENGFRGLLMPIRLSNSSR